MHFFIYFSDRNSRRLPAVQGGAEAVKKTFLIQKEKGPGRELTAVGRFRKLRARLILRYTEAEGEA